LQEVAHLSHPLCLAGRKKFGSVGRPIANVDYCVDATLHVDDQVAVCVEGSKDLHEDAVLFIWHLHLKVDQLIEPFQLAIGVDGHHWTLALTVKIVVLEREHKLRLLFRVVRREVRSLFVIA
jgi:hypothetical protein